jgi:large-conductance mechanosensitive channel
MFRKNNENEENEVSGGQVFGYILIGLAVVIIIAFVIFVGIKMATGGGKKDAKPQQVASVEVSTLALEDEEKPVVE